MIAIPFVPITDVRLFDDGDMPWIAQLLDLVERSLGEPWRVLLERIDHAPLYSDRREVPARMRQAIVSALLRILGGGAERSRIARRLRACVLGHPALDRETREARIASAADQLGIEAADVESLLWADLARERPVVLSGGRPDPRILAAFANVDRIQREVRRAREVELRVWDNVHELVRVAARCGLLTSVTRTPDAAYVLRITGPLALFHSTTVYGRALGALVPMLADHPRFELAIHCEFASGPRTLRVEPPVLLAPFTPRWKPSIAERLARDLERAHQGVVRDPEPVTIGDHVLFPDLAIGQTLVEVLGFSTSEYIAEKLARYRAAHQRVILCVDTKRSKLAEPHANVLAFERRVDADALAAAAGGADGEAS